jgi:hypothetical protein
MKEQQTSKSLVLDGTRKPKKIIARSQYWGSNLKSCCKEAAAGLWVSAGSLACSPKRFSYCKIATMFINSAGQSKSHGWSCKATDAKAASVPRLEGDINIDAHRNFNEQPTLLASRLLW